MSNPRYQYDPIAQYTHDFVILASEQEIGCEPENAALERAVIDTLKVAFLTLKRVNAHADHYIMTALEELTDDCQDFYTELPAHRPTPRHDYSQLDLLEEYDNGQPE